MPRLTLGSGVSEKGGVGGDMGGLVHRLFKQTGNPSGSVVHCGFTRAKGYICDVGCSNTPTKGKQDCH